MTTTKTKTKIEASICRKIYSEIFKFLRFKKIAIATAAAPVTKARMGCPSLLRDIKALKKRAYL